MKESNNMSRTEIHIDYGDETIILDFNLLENIILKELIDEGLDPLNSNDIISFWKYKGIDLDNANILI